MTDAIPLSRETEALPAEAYFQPHAPRLTLEFMYTPTAVQQTADGLMHDAEMGHMRQKQSQLSTELDLLQERFAVETSRLQAATEVRDKESQEFVDSQLTRTNVGILILLVVVGVFMVMMARGYIRRQAAVPGTRIGEAAEPMVLQGVPQESAPTPVSITAPVVKHEVKHINHDTVEAAMAAALEALGKDEPVTEIRGREEERQLEPLINLDPELLPQPDDKAAYQLGSEAMRKKNFDDAIKHFKKALKMNPSFADASFNLGAAYAFKDDYKKAIKQFDKTIELRPEHPDPYFNRGMCKLRSGDASGAINDFNAAEKRGFTQSSFFLYRAKAFAAAGKFAYATSDLNHYLAAKPQHAEALLLRAKCQRSLMVYDEAQADYEKAAKLKNYAEAWYGLACMQSLRGQPEEALNSLAKAVAKDKKYKDKALDEADLFHLFQTDEFTALTA